MYYTDEGMSNYYAMWKQAKEFEKMRKKKAKLEAERKKKLEKERIRIKNKQKRLERIEAERQRKREQRQKDLEDLKEVGYKPSWTKRNPLKRAKNSRDLNLCKEIYEKAKAGQSTYSLAKEYDLHPNTILRHKYEYEYYLGMKTLDKEVSV